MSEIRNGSQNGGKPQRSWPENVRVRGVAILSKMVMPILHDKGDEFGRAMKVVVRDIMQHERFFTFVLGVPDDIERGRLIGPRCLHLSALSVLFAAALRATFRSDERPNVVVGIWDAERKRTLMPQKLFTESELEPEGSEDEGNDEEDDEGSDDDRRDAGEGGG